ncbi:MAG: multidrug resistance efflux transporter family protein [Schaedlerella sp.]|nr:multidrug resistance efflux transporter family protein [Schaedlerella sp.]
MKKAFTYGILSSAFFAFTFVLNRSMQLGGGHWIWSASLRYFFSLPILLIIVHHQKGLPAIHLEMRINWKHWLLWSTVGFGLFYAPLTAASIFGESWFVAATWQVTIVTGSFMAPLFGKKIPVKNIFFLMIILFGIFLMQTGHIRTGQMGFKEALISFALILLAAICYPLGNRKTMMHCPPDISTNQRVYGMTVFSMPFWIILSAYAVTTHGLPSSGQVLQSLLVTIFSSILATLLFFEATNLVKDDPKQLAVVESTLALEVIFTLIGGVLFLGDPLPTTLGFVGIGIIIIGMICNNLITTQK